MKYIKTFESYNNKKSQVEVYYRDEIVADFELVNGVFMGISYINLFKKNDDPEIIKLGEKYSIDNDFSPKELSDMLDEWIEILPEINIVGQSFLKELF